MFFLIRMAFWFSLVLLVLPLDAATENGQDSISPVQAFFAAREAVDDVAGICERKPDVCAAGKAAMQTIGSRARETARVAYEMLDEESTDEIGQMIAVGDDLVSADAETTGSIPSSN